MREIKFRAWQKYHEKMLEVTGITLDDNGKLESVHTFHPYQTPKRIVYSKWRDDFWLYDKEGESSLELMQYTGLVDKNGFEIYEGDIVKVKWQKGEDVGVVKYFINSFCVCEMERHSPTDLGLLGLEYEVIGNVYEKREGNEV